MTVISDYYRTQGLVFSIVALSIAPLLPLFFRQYFRGLQFLQMSYLFSSVMLTTAFSSYLTPAMISFNKNILTFCTAGDFVCSNGFALSFGAVLVGLMVVTFIFVSLRKCCNKQIEYQPVFLTLKGFIKWFYLPLAFTSAVVVLSLVYFTIDLTTFLPPAVVLGVLAIFPFLQLIAKKCSQNENASIWQKWLQFLGYLRLLSTAVLTACYIHYLNEIYLHLIMIALIIYPILHTWKGDFKYPIMERIIYFLGEAAFLALFFLFKYKPQYISDYDIDFFVLGGILLFDTLLYLIRTIKLACYGAHEGSNVVNPEGGEISAAKLETSPRVEKRSKYEHDSGQELHNSREYEQEGLNKKGTLKKRR